MVIRLGVAVGSGVAAIRETVVGDGEDAVGSFAVSWFGVAVGSDVVAAGEAVAEDGAVAGVNGAESSSLQAITVSNIRRAV